MPLPFVVTELIKDFAYGEKCTLCHVRDDPLVECPDCKDEERKHNQYCTDCTHPTTARANVYVCIPHLTAYLKHCVDCWALTVQSDCFHCEKEHVCGDCLSYTHEGPACEKCYDEWISDNFG